jgi:hypothetical protein
MATHTVHPDTHENGLADDCPRCDELAASPLELDETNFLAAWERMLEVEFSRGNGAEHYRSENEAKLCRDHLYRYAVFLQRYTPVDPVEIVEQLA